MSDSESAVSNTVQQIEQIVRADKLKLLFHLSFPALFVALATAVLLAWLVRHVAPAAVLWGWLAALSVATLIRLAMFVAYFRRQPQGLALLRWERPYVVTLMLSSLTWGLGATAVMAVVPLLEQVICIFIMVGMAGGAVSTYSAMHRTALFAMLAVLLPGTLWMVWQADEIHLGVAMGTTIFMVTSLRSIRLQASALRCSLQLSRELELAHISAEALARTDALTGLSNRRAFFERGQQIVSYCERNRRPLSMLLMDVDHFKQINDSCGHAGGDAALSHVGELLQRQFRKADVCGRIGGEEFAVLLPDTELADACVLAETLRQVIAATPIPAGAQQLSITVSVGVAAGGYDLELLLSQADAAMYRAKAQGRNLVVC